MFKLRSEIHNTWANSIKLPFTITDKTKKECSDAFQWWIEYITEVDKIFTKNQKKFEGIKIRSCHSWMGLLMWDLLNPNGQIFSHSAKVMAKRTYKNSYNLFNLLPGLTVSGQSAMALAITNLAKLMGNR